jgi:hypothetical protein
VRSISAHDALLSPLTSSSSNGGGPAVVPGGQRLRGVFDADDLAIATDLQLIGWHAAEQRRAADEHVEL